MPKRGMFRPDHTYQMLDVETAGRAFACLYALHGTLFKKEERRRKRNGNRRRARR